MNGLTAGGCRETMAGMSSQKRILFAVIVCAFGYVVVASLLLAPTRARNRFAGMIGAQYLVSPARPDTTPFDDADALAARTYQETYARGYAWAWGQFHT
jgi:hypothetical protein